MATRQKHKERSRCGYSKHFADKQWWFRNSERWAGIASSRRKAMKGA